MPNSNGRIRYHTTTILNLPALTGKDLSLPLTLKYVNSCPHFCNFQVLIQ